MECYEVTWESGKGLVIIEGIAKIEVVKIDVPQYCQHTYNFRGDNVHTGHFCGGGNSA